MKIKTIAPAALREMYAPCLQRDFPPDELMPLARMEQLASAGLQSTLGFYEQGELAAYAVLILSGGGSPCALLNYFAVEKALRGRGVGSRSLKLLREAAAGMGLDYIVFEVEKPGAARSQEELALRRRRVRFYLSGGALPTGVDSRLFGVDYHIMVLPAGGAPPEDQELAASLSALYRTAVPEPPGPGLAFQDVCQVYAPGRAMDR